MNGHLWEGIAAEPDGSIMLLSVLRVGARHLLILHHPTNTVVPLEFKSRKERDAAVKDLDARVALPMDDWMKRALERQEAALAKDGDAA